MLQIEITQRDREISVIMQMLGKQKASDGQQPFIASVGQADSALQGMRSSAAAPAASAASPLVAVPTSLAAAREHAPAPGPAAPVAAPKTAAAAAHKAKAKPQAPPLPPSADAAALLLDKRKAFEEFQKSVYKPPPSVEENKALLQERILGAKGVGAEANAVRVAITEAKNRLERLRLERAMIANDAEEGPEESPEELAEVQEIDRFKARYRDKTAELRELKGEIEMIQRLFEQSNAKMQKEFEAWFSGLRKQAQLTALDEETKRELYEKVVGANGTPVAKAAGGRALPSPSGSTPVAVPQSTSHRHGCLSQASLPVGSSSGADSSVPGIPASTSHSRRPRTPSQPAAFAASPRSRPLSASKTGDGQTDDDIAAYYAALGELATRT